MIRLINDKGIEILLNSSMIEHITEDRECEITLKTGDKVNVKNSYIDILQKIDAYKIGLAEANKETTKKDDDKKDKDRKDKKDKDRKGKDNKENKDKENKDKENKEPIEYNREQKEYNREQKEYNKAPRTHKTKEFSKKGNR